MPTFRRKGPRCIAPTVTGDRVIETGDEVDAPITTGWGDDPDWEQVQDDEEEE